MSLVYVFICTKSTADVFVPPFPRTLEELGRWVSSAFAAIAGGWMRAGDLVFRPKADAFNNHLLCDGSTITKDQFPQLVRYLGGDGATSAVLPNYLTGLTFASEAPDQTVTTGGSVVIGTPTPTPTPTGGQTGGSGGNVSSGGRARNPFERIP